MEIQNIELESKLFIIKNNQTITLTHHLTDDPGIVRIAIQAPLEIDIDREEIYKLKLANSQEKSIKEQQKQHSKNIQSLFELLSTVTCKSEKLEQAAKYMFNKDKILIPKSLAKIAQGEMTTTAWIATCAIDILISEKPEQLKTVLSEHQLFRMWAKPLLLSGHSKEVLSKAMQLNCSELIKLINKVAR